MFRTVILVLISAEILIAQRCPPIFGDFECPIGFNCSASDCISANSKDVTAPNDCDSVECSNSTRCFQGRCYPAIGLACNRNLRVSDLKTKTVISNCGLTGKCINGRCVEDRCANKVCSDDDLCLDGTCWLVTEKFCVTSFDCGPQFECVQNKCQPLRRPVPCNCDPGETCQQGQCFPDPKCAHVTCPSGETCTDGVCSTAVNRDCNVENCEVGAVCIDGKCVPDPCANRCPPDHACREGQCRLLQGLSCHDQCPAEAYVCVSGHCTRNECAGKSCDQGETCENGICVQVEGRLCSLAIRDCGQDFECAAGKCHDLLEKM